MKKLLKSILLLALPGLLIIAAGCERAKIDAALESDANGYLCQGCGAKFYTGRSVFANHCPKCQNMKLSQVVGFVCPEDKHVTVAPRGFGTMNCEKCGKPVSSLSIPKEADFKAWGAEKKTKTEVGA